MPWRSHANPRGAWNTGQTGAPYRKATCSQGRAVHRAQRSTSRRAHDRWTTEKRRHFGFLSLQARKLPRTGNPLRNDYRARRPQTWVRSHLVQLGLETGRTD
jgi:hypothetical protein